VPVEQVAVARVERMPNIPQPFKMKDWRVVALGFDRLAFDFDRTGEHLPIIWWDDSRINMDRRGFGIPSYVGPAKQGTAHEGITVMGCVLGATFAGIDKAAGAHNWVLLCEQYYNRKNGQNLVLNGVDAATGGSFWYEVFPHVFFYALADRYPGTGEMEAIVKRTVDRWCEACDRMVGEDGVPDFDRTAFDFRTMTPVDNGRWKEPDAAAGIAWLQYMAWTRWREDRHLRAAKACMEYLHRRKDNPYYEVMLPFGAYVAARMNAELRCSYDVHKLIIWCFERSAVRPDMAVVAEAWGGVDCHGLVGGVNRPPSRPATGGYAFAMNTFAMAWPMVPLVRYDERYARAIGKWMLNAANAARLFYPNEHPPERQSCPGWKGDPDGVIAYEGLRHRWDGDEELFASGDPIKHHWGPKTDLGLYGSGLVGVFGGIIRRTNVEGILQLDCLATDSFVGKAYPTYLYFNPYAVAQDVQLDVGPVAKDLYETTRSRFLARNVAGTATLTIPADSAVVLVLAPAGGRFEINDGRARIDGVIVDYRAGAQQR